MSISLGNVRLVSRSNASRVGMELNSKGWTWKETKSLAKRASLFQGDREEQRTLTPRKVYPLACACSRTKLTRGCRSCNETFPFSRANKHPHLCPDRIAHLVFERCTTRRGSQVIRCLRWIRRLESLRFMPSTCEIEDVPNIHRRFPLVVFLEQGLVRTLYPRP